MKHAGKFIALLLASAALAATPAYAERGGHGGPRAGGHQKHAQAHERASHGHARAHQAHERARHRAQERMHLAQNEHRAHRRHDRDNNPPGRAGGPGTNWENPPGPKGGPGASPDRRVHPAVRDPGVNARQHFQRDRIGQGVRSGELTKQETMELAAGQRAIRKEERAYKSDGKLTKDERKDLHQDLNAASKSIYEEKHDAERR